MGDMWVLSVAAHKTAIKGPARLTLDDANMRRLTSYVERIQPSMDPLETSEKVLILPGARDVTNSEPHKEVASQIQLGHPNGNLR